MKLHASELPLGKPQTRRKTSKLAPLVALIVFLTIPLYYPTIKESSKRLYETSLAYDEPSEDPIRPTSHLDTLPSCSDGSTPCNEPDKVVPLHEQVVTGKEPENQSGGDIAVDQHELVDDGINKDANMAVDHHEPAIVEMKHENEPHIISISREKTSNEGKSGGDMAAQKDGAAATRKKTEKGRRKRPHRPETRDRSTSLKDSSKYGNEKEPINRSSDGGTIRSKLLNGEQCDLFSGEWVPNPEGPYYTNNTCNAIQEHQNCLKFGRPDAEFLKWRWKPDDCELPVFDPNQFLELVRGKSLAFIGDSVARNHMQSLICLLSSVAQPVDLSDPLDQNKRYEYREYDFNISIFWAPYLVKTEKTDPNDEKRPFKLFLDEFDEHWTSNIAPFDYVIISAGHWFFRPTYFYINNRLIGCLYCQESNVSHLTSFFSYRRAFRTAFRAINAAANFTGTVFLRTFAPSHFEGAAWDRGGDCARTGPYKRNETALEDYSREMYTIQLEELRIAQRAGRTGGRKIRLFDATKSMLLRPDGHPSKYGHWPGATLSFPNDCVHWCLPGPIDSWNDFLQELLKREVGDNR